MSKHVFFDLDNTLTKSRRPIQKEYEPTFEELCRERDVIIVTGGTDEHIQQQLGPATHRYFILGQSGNHAMHKNGTELWREELSEKQLRAIYVFIDLLKAAFAVPVRDEEDLVENRGAQVGYSVIGYHEDPAKKDAFDPGFSRRKEMLAKFPKEHAMLKKVGIEVLPAGSSGFNFTLIGKDKGVNVARLIDHEGWKKEECLYVGDALGPGENDFSVVGVIKTQQVKDPDDTFLYIEQNLLPHRPEPHSR
jgi:HAD superfamily hydrolase (TIGR01484 family)